MRIYNYILKFSHLLTSRGRINRIQYLIDIIKVILISGLLFFLEKTIMRKLGENSIFFSLVIFLWLFLATTAKRLHDFNQKEPWSFQKIWMIVLIIPISIIIIPQALLRKGNKNENDYGEPPSFE